MAAGKFKVYELAKLHLSGTFSLATNTFKATLHSSASNANTLTTSSAFADITSELATANGYTAGGVTLTGVSWTNSGGTITFTGTIPSWTASGGSIVFRYIVIRASGTLNSIVDPILCVALGDTTPADVTISNGVTFTFNVNASGIFTLSGATAD